MRIYRVRWRRPTDTEWHRSKIYRQRPAALRAVERHRAQGLDVELHEARTTPWEYVLVELWEDF